MLKKRGIFPLKGLGQNFLVQRTVLCKIVKVAELASQDIVLEIGPGIGTLTKELAKRTKKVVAVEKDPRMVGVLKETLKDFKNVEIIQKDILKIKNLELNKNLKLKIKNYKIVANLPYYITAPVIRKFLEAKNPPKLMVLLVQKEVGERICASPSTTFKKGGSSENKGDRQKVVEGKPPRLRQGSGGQAKMSKLSVFCQFYGKPEIISLVPKTSFWPSPKVESVILKITFKKFLNKLARSHQFVKIVKAGFSQPRKQLLNNLSKELNLGREKVENWLLENNIKPTQRAETLTVEDWIKLTKTLPGKSKISSKLEFYSKLKI
ncbi:MAG: rRNA adenine dimethyltransferase family protein [Patescibacteria group bacterium]|nr:rRNA adenine dimethyltransferase family protein [Patescibacteria group bacterium]